MKYDRPVWQLMHACADDLPETFRYDDVRTWFAANFPEVSDATIRAHVVGLTEGGAKHPQFERRSPIFRRVDRGVYAPIPLEDRGELPEDDPYDLSAGPVRFTAAPRPEDESATPSEKGERRRRKAGTRELDADRRRLTAEREAMARITAEGAEYIRTAQTEIGAERARLKSEQAEAELLMAEQARAGAAQAEVGRLQAERIEAERVAKLEKKRGRKLRKSARKEREIAEMLERDRIERDRMERKARRGAERRARDQADRQVREVAERLQLDSDERQRTAMSVRDQLARLEQDALLRLEVERALRVRAEADQDVRERSGQQEREQQERELLEREQQELQMTLHPNPEGEPPSIDAQILDDVDPSSGGIVIIRAPRHDADPDADATPEEHASELDRVEPGRPPCDAVLLGSIGERLRVPAPARDAFRDLAFRRARLDAELSGARWFVMSADHGLLEPGEWMSPDERAMTDIEPEQRAAWASWVVARLESLVGKLPGQLVQVEAPGAIAEPVLAALREAGASVVAGLTDQAEPVELTEAPDPDRPVQTAQSRGPDAQVIPFARGGPIAEHLSDPRHAVPAAHAHRLPHHPGVYAWSVDHAGSRDLNRALRLPVRPGVVYVGQVGGSASRSDAGSSLNDHVTRVQLQGPARSSTFRMTLAAALAGRLGLHTIDDPRLTRWMLDHLSISAWPTSDVASLHTLKASAVDDLRPVLNTDWGNGTEYRDRIAELSDRLA